MFTLTIALGLYSGQIILHTDESGPSFQDATHLAPSGNGNSLSRLKFFAILSFSI